MHSLLTSLVDFDRGQNHVAAIIIKTSGSTYRKTGAMMLIDQNLNYRGLLSGGCLEDDIVQHCRNVLAKREDHIIEYNMRDEADMLWGMGLGCDGEVSILLKYLPANQQHFGFFSALESLNNGISQSLSINFSQHNQIKFETQTSFAQQAIETATADKLSIHMKAPHHLLICGGSPDVPPVTAIAHQIGWKTMVIDHRKAFADSDKFPFADKVEHLNRSSWKDLNLQKFDSAIIMSHQFERDQSYLAKLLKSPIAYIGLLGPSKRRNKLLEQCGTDFNQQKGRVFGPIGLDIGAGSPETIALAIISEIQAIKNGKQDNQHIDFCYQDPSR